MDTAALLLSRLQFAFMISFHIIFPAFTIGLAAWLTALESLHLATGRPAYQVVFEFWLKIIGVAFGLGMAWRRSGMWPPLDEPGQCLGAPLPTLSKARLKHARIDVPNRLGIAFNICGR